MGWPVLGYLLGKNFWRRDRDHLVPPRRMDAAVCRAEVCYPFCREAREALAVKRREFITLLGGAAAWPLAARAQQREKMRRIGVLTGGFGPDSQARLEAFLKALVHLGWRDGENVRLEIRRGGGDADAIRKHAVELAALAPDVIMAIGGTATERL